MKITIQYKKFGNSVRILTIVACFLSFLRTDAQTRKYPHAQHTSGLKPRDKVVSSRGRIDSLFCISATVPNININVNTKIKSIEKKDFALDIQYPLSGHLVCLADVPEVHVNNEWEYLPVRVLLGR